MCQPNPKHCRVQSQLQQLPPSQWDPVHSGLGQQGDQQVLHMQDAGGCAQTSPSRTGGQEEKLPLLAEQVQGQLLPQLLRAQGIAFILWAERRQLGRVVWPRARGWGAAHCMPSRLLAGNAALAGIACSCSGTTVQPNGKQQQACTWLSAWAMDFPLGFLRAALLKLICRGERSSTHTCDRVWRTWALRAQVVQKPGDLGHKDLPSRSPGRGVLVAIHA